MTYIYSYTKGNQAYIGKTKNLSDRKSKHKIRFYGWDYQVIDSINSVKKEDWKPLESCWITAYEEGGYVLENKNKGGNGRTAFRTQEHFDDYNRQYYLNRKEERKEHKAQYDKQYAQNNKLKKNEYMKKYQFNKRHFNQLLTN